MSQAAPGIGSLLGKAAGPIGMGIQMIPKIFQFFHGLKQGKQAKAINPIDPGFQANNEIYNNQRIVNDIYNNYQIPGMSQITNNMNQNFASGFSAAAGGATSSGDLIDAVTRMTAGNTDAINALGIQQAQGKEAMLNNVLDANYAAGNEGVRRNTFDLDRYDKKLQEKAALQEASTQNMYGAADGIATAAGSFLNYRTPAFTGPNIGNIELGPSSFAKRVRNTTPKKFGDLD